MSIASKTLLGLAGGLGLGVALVASGSALLERILGTTDLVGQLFVNGIRMTVLPLIVSSLVAGVASSHSPRGVGRLLAHALGAFVVAAAAAATFATVVAFGIVYNSARISLSERQRELATLRVLGFTRGEVGAVLVGELVMLAVVAIPLGLIFGSMMAKAILTSVNTETVRLPLILTPANYAFATLVIVVATTLSLVFACRKLAQLDLVAVLKARD